MLLSPAYMSLRLIKAYRSDAWGPRSPDDRMIVATLLLRWLGMMMLGALLLGLILGFGYDPRLVAIGPGVMFVGMLLRPARALLRCVTGRRSPAQPVERPPSHPKEE